MRQSSQHGACLAATQSWAMPHSPSVQAASHLFLGVAVLSVFSMVSKSFSFLSLCLPDSSEAKSSSCNGGEQFSIAGRRTRTFPKYHSPIDTNHTISLSPLTYSLI